MRHTFFYMPYNDVINNAIELNMPNTGVYDKQQRREFGQQAALQLQAQDFATDYAGKMRKMKEAGINPMLAAGGLAGAHSPSISSVPSTAVGQGANIARTAAEAVQTALGGAKDIVDSISTAKKIEPEIKNLDADTNKKLAEYGLSNEQIYSWQVDNKYKDINAQVDLRTKLLNEKNTAKQWEVMHAQYELMTTQLDTEIAKQKDLYEHAKLNASHVGLADAQKAYYDALQKKTDYEAQWSGIRIEWWNKQGYDLLNSSSDAIMVQRLENGLYNQEIIKEWSNYYGARVDAEQSAIGDNAFRNSYRSSLGEAYASWFARPNSSGSLIADIGSKLAAKINKGIVSNDEARKEIKRHNDFQKAFSEFRATQKENLEKLRKQYKALKRGGNSVAAAEAFRKYQNALAVYDDFDEDDFTDLLLNQY